MQTFIASSHNQIFVYKTRRMGWVANVARMEAMRGASRVLVGKSEGKRPLWRPRRRGGYVNKM